MWAKNVKIAMFYINVAIEVNLLICRQKLNTIPKISHIIPYPNEIFSSSLKFQVGYTPIGL
jgi:hypothetical protein